MCRLGQTLFQQADIVVSCTGLLKPGGSENTEKPVGTFFICISYLGRIYHYHYFYQVMPNKNLKLSHRK